VDVRICKNCGERFMGRPNKLYCSSPCRRGIEFRRRSWERAQRWAVCWEDNANWSIRTPQQREYYLNLADEVRRTAGLRP